MSFRWEYIAAGLGLLLAVGVASSRAGVGTMGAWEAVGRPAEAVPADVVAPADVPPAGVPAITADELAADLLAGAPGLTVVDVRAADESPADRIPVAYWMPLDDAGWQPPGPFPEHRRLVLVAAAADTAEAAWSHARGLGYERVAVLDGGQAAWNARYGDPQEPGADASRLDWQDYRARRAASLYLTGGFGALDQGAPGKGSEPPAAAPPPLPARRLATSPGSGEGC